MQYRKFGKLDWRVSVLGFGTMRLPLLESDPSRINESESIRIIRYAIDRGVNYLDTGYLYHGGRSEIVVGRALQGGYRKKIKLATKLPGILIDSAGDFDHILDEQLERLHIDKIDFYLLHALNRRTWLKLRDLKVIHWAEGAIKHGRICHLGFSFHDEFDVFKEIIDAYDNWTLCQIQYNYVDTFFQAGTKGLKYAAKKGLAVVVMEPLRGGALAKKPPKQVAKVWAQALRKCTFAEWGLRWVWNHPEVSVALSGMSTMEQVMENIDIANRSVSGYLLPEEIKLVGQVRRVYRRLRPIPCTGCLYCMPCPNGVEISHIFSLYNDTILYDATRSRFQYRQADLNEEQRADNCRECGECIEKCPQKIFIPEWLKKAHSLLSTNEDAERS